MKASKKNGKVRMSAWPNGLGFEVTDTIAGKSGAIQNRGSTWAVRINRANGEHRVLTCPSFLSPSAAWELAITGQI